MIYVWSLWCVHPSMLQSISHTNKHLKNRRVLSQIEEEKSCNSVWFFVYQRYVLCFSLHDTPHFIRKRVFFLASWLCMHILCNEKSIFFTYSFVQLLASFLWQFIIKCSLQESIGLHIHILRKQIFLRF